MKPEKIKTYDHETKKEKGISFTIDHNGNWYAHAAEIGQPGIIQREALAKLFSGAGEGVWAGRGLMFEVETGKYHIKTPYVSYEVEVEDLPFVITSYHYENDILMLQTQYGESVAANNESPIELSYSEYHKQNLPEIEIRKGLKARLGRHVFYELLNRHAKEKGEVVGVESAGSFYPLGNVRGDTNE